MSELASEPSELTGGFVAAYGREPERTWAAPGRVNLIGEHTDYNDGFALPIALPLATVAAIAVRPGTGGFRIASAQRPESRVEIAAEDLRPDAVPAWARYVAGVIWALREAGHDLPGLDIWVDGKVPEGSGLSSSAALECAVAGAVDDLAGLTLSRLELCRIAQRAENDFAGAPTGIMDQTASMLTTADHALLLDCRTLDTRQVPFDLPAAGLGLLVIDTRVEHSNVAGEYAARRRSCEQAAQALDVPALRDVSVTDLDGPAVAALDSETRARVRHVVTENARTLATVDRLDAGEIRGIGSLLTASHVSLRDDYAVSAPELDTAVDAALAAGALGARMTGAGFGGCAIALVERGDLGAVARSVEQAYAAADFRPPGFIAAAASPGAHRRA